MVWTAVLFRKFQLPRPKPTDMKSFRKEFTVLALAIVCLLLGFRPRHNRGRLPWLPM